MKVLVIGVATVSIEIPEELVRSFEGTSAFGDAWCRNLSAEINNLEATSFDIIFKTNDVHEGLSAARDNLEITHYAI